MDSNLFDNVNPVRLSADSSSNDDFHQAAHGSPLRPLMEDFYSGDGMNQDDIMSGALPPSTATVTQQPTMSGALLEGSQAQAQDKDDARDPSANVTTPSARVSEPVNQTYATAGNAPSLDNAPVPPIPLGATTTTNRTVPQEHDLPLADTATAAVVGGREASVDLGDGQSHVHVQETTEITETEINGQSVVVESHVEVIEETGREGPAEDGQNEPMTIDKHVETVIETPVPGAEIETQIREAVGMDIAVDIAADIVADIVADIAEDIARSSPVAAEPAGPGLSSPDSRSDDSIPTGTPQQQHLDSAVGSMSVPPKRKAANLPAEPGAKRRRRTAADMLVDASSSFVSSDYSDRKKRSVPIQPDSMMAATPIKTPGRKKAKAAGPQVAALKTPKVKPTVRKSMAAETMASPVVRARTPRSAPGKVATKPPKSIAKPPVSAKHPTATIVDETPKRRGRPPKNPSTGTPATTPAKTSAQAKTPTTEPARRGRPISAGKRASPLKKRHSLSARLSAPKVSEAETSSTPKTKVAPTPKSVPKPKAAPADPPKRRGRPPKNATSQATTDASRAAGPKMVETAPRTTRPRQAKVGEKAVKPTRGKASAPAPKATRGRPAKTTKAEPSKPATTAGRRPERPAKSEAKDSIAQTTAAPGRRQQATAPKASETIAEAPKRRGRPPKASTAAAAAAAAAATATTVTPPASRKRGRGADKAEIVEPEPKKQKTARGAKAALKPEPAPESVKKNKGGRPPKKAPSTENKGVPRVKSAQEQDSAKAKPVSRGRRKQTEPASEPTKSVRGRGRGRSGKGDVAPAKEKPAAKGAKKTSVASGRVTKAKATPRGGAAATRSLRSRT